MKNLREFKQYRIVNDGLLKIYGLEVLDSEDFGCFIVSFKGTDLHIIASRHDGWDHVSVSLPKRIPNWYEMDYIKMLFFKDNEVAFQYHVTKEQHVNIHPNCLHLWRPQHMTILLPPKILV